MEGDRLDMSVNGRPTPLPEVATLLATGSSTSGNGLTVTLPAAGSGLFHYITEIQIVAITVHVPVTGTMAIATVTTTNLYGNTYSLGIDRLNGSIDRNSPPKGSPVRSTVANTATTIVCPATTNCAWNVNVEYYVGV